MKIIEKWLLKLQCKIMDHKLVSYNKGVIVCSRTFLNKINNSHNTHCDYIKCDQTMNEKKSIG